MIVSFCLSPETPALSLSVRSVPLSIPFQRFREFFIKEFIYGRYSSKKMCLDSKIPIFLICLFSIRFRHISLFELENGNNPVSPNENTIEPEIFMTIFHINANIFSWFDCFHESTVKMAGYVSFLEISWFVEWNHFASPKA